MKFSEKVKVVKEKVGSNSKRLIKYCIETEPPKK